MMQEEEPSLVHHPVNAYNLMRHVAVGWSVVENTLEEEVKKKFGNVGKRVSKVLARRAERHIPDQVYDSEEKLQKLFKYIGIFGPQFADHIIYLTLFEV